MFPVLIFALFVLSPSPPPARVIPDVPFIPQKKERCGPAALAIVLHYYGARVSPDDLAREVYRREISGTLNLDLLLAARRHGFDGQAAAGTPAELKRWIDRGVPVIVLLGLHPPQTVFHYAVVYGYDDATRVFTLHSAKSPGAVLSYDEFAAAWAAASSWMLVVKRKDVWP